jgi:hypothetical protein
MTPPEDESGRTEAQQEWAAWAAHGYRKMYMPRSMRLFGLSVFLLVALMLLAVLWFATH